MQIVGAKWEPGCNRLFIRCDGCGAVLEHRADRWRVSCSCGRRGHLEVIRERYLLEHNATAAAQPVAA